MPAESRTAAVSPEYLWPDAAARSRFSRTQADGLFDAADLRETAASIASDSRWPAFFPSPICLVTAGHGHDAVIERVVGPMIVNRFPLVMAVSVCRDDLSARHYARRAFMERLEASGAAAVQFVTPGSALGAALDAIGDEPDPRASARLRQSGLATRTTATTGTTVLRDAYLVYEGRLARPGTSIDGAAIYPRPWLDVGSHRVYFLEVAAIQLDSAVAQGARQIAWGSLPRWTPTAPVTSPAFDPALLGHQRYVKSYTPDYRFPAAGTVAFEADATEDGLAVRHLAPLGADQVVVDNERARWPCFFPSSAGMLTAWTAEGGATAMPCGSTAVVSRLPLTFAVCISNSSINERYATRASLAQVRAAGRFGVGVPHASPRVVDAIGYLGNISYRTDPDKVRHAGLTAMPGGPSPVLAELPVHFDCRVAGEVTLGTHVMVLGEVDRVHVRRDVGPSAPLAWQPWASLA
ncbi:MAG: flavin reductase family protein [Vicinamibacterales bacterium]